VKKNQRGTKRKRLVFKFSAWKRPAKLKKDRHRRLRGILAIVVATNGRISRTSQSTFRFQDCTLGRGSTNAEQEWIAVCSAIWHQRGACKDLHEYFCAYIHILRTTTPPTPPLSNSCIIFSLSWEAAVGFFFLSFLL